MSDLLISRHRIPGVKGVDFAHRVIIGHWTYKDLERLECEEIDEENAPFRQTYRFTYGAGRSLARVLVYLPEDPK